MVERVGEGTYAQLQNRRKEQMPSGKDSAFPGWLQQAHGPD